MDSLTSSRLEETSSRRSWGTVGAFVGELEFEVIVIPPSTLTEFTVSELFVMEAEGTITIEELVA
ncbi:MAG: hypothetical protein MK126_00910 [Dehalococcoidia bacterium]|nr:hypothetical protein [Dehalococcoidia bacterium]